MRRMYYILDDDKNPVPASGIMEWAKFCEGKFRRVDKTKIGPVEVSTIFTGTDLTATIHGGPPRLFETMIFEGPYSGAQFRTTSWDHAQRTHDRCVRLVLDLTNPIPYIIHEIREYFTGLDEWMRFQFQHPNSLLPNHD